MKYLTNSGLSYFLNKIKAYLTSSTYLNSIGIFPNNDNSVDLGASSKNIKMIYTKGITINGTQFLPSDYATLSGLATVATSGSYNDLSNKPTIPTVNNATLTIQKNGTTVKTFTANASSNVTANITVPTKTSDLTNDSGFLTSHQDLSGYVPKAGGAVLSGQTYSRTIDNGILAINGSSTDENGAFLRLHGKDYGDTPFAGSVFIRANNGSNACNMLLKPDGTATWGGKNIDTIEEQGNGYIRYSNGLQICWGVIRGVDLEPFNGHYGKLISYPKSFLANTDPSINISQWRGTGNLTQNFNMYIVTESYVGIETDNGWGIYYTVFGMWK